MQNGGVSRTTGSGEGVRKAGGGEKKADSGWGAADNSKSSGNANADFADFSSASKSNDDFDDFDPRALEPGKQVFLV